MVIYAYQLTIGATAANIEVWRVGGLQAICMMFALCFCAFLLRAGAGLPKYVVWALASLGVQYARRTTQMVPPAARLQGWPAWGWSAALLVSGAAVFALGVRKSRAAAQAAAHAVEARAAPQQSAAERDGSGSAKGEKEE